MVQDNQLLKLGLYYKSLKLIEKHLIDLRNMFSYQENIDYCSQNKKNELTEKNFLVSPARKFDLN